MMAIHAARNPTPAERTLDARAQAVLAAVIKENLATGEPVGSKTVAESFTRTAHWSSATIRNVMGELEDAGLVEQPHTSAGRIPTDKGYRYYVDHIIGDARLSGSDLSRIEETFHPSQPSRADADDFASPARLMERASHLLSTLSENVGIVVAPSFAENGVQHIEFVRLGDGRVLVVLVFASSMVQHKVVRIDEPLTQDELERTARYLNAEFTGKSLRAIRAEILRLMREEQALYDRLLRHAALLCERSLAGEEDETAGDVYVDGASNIVSKPEFADAERLRELFRTLEEKSRLVKILNECILRPAQSARFGGVQVVIGRENAMPSLQNCALFTAPYRVGAGEAVGTLGVIGPMRIEYARMFAVVNHIARLVQQTLSAGD